MISITALNELIAIKLILPHTMCPKLEHIVCEMFMPKKKNTGHFKWNSTFDRLLTELIKGRSSQPWTEIARLLKNNILRECPNVRLKTFPNGKQCRDRWVEYLDPCVSRKPFTQEQIDFIFKRRRDGAGYAQIGRELGHSANQVKNAYYCKKQKRVETPVIPLVFDVKLPSMSIEMNTSSTSVSDAPDSPKFFSNSFVTQNLSFFSEVSEPSCDPLNELYDLRSLSELADDMLSDPYCGHGTMDKNF